MKTITALKKQNKSLKVMLQTAKQRRNDAIQQTEKINASKVDIKDLSHKQRTIVEMMIRKSKHKDKRGM